MIETEVEMLYFKNDVKKAKGVELDKEKIKKICEEHNAQLKMKDKTPGNMPQLSINIFGADESILKSCVKEIISMYGKPDLPGGFLLGAEKKRGNELVRSILNNETI